MDKLPFFVKHNSTGSFFYSIVVVVGLQCNQLEIEMEMIITTYEAI